MNAKRFKARDMRTALTLVREKLGEDAIILSNKRIEGGVEIIATSPTIAEEIGQDNKKHAEEIARRLAAKSGSAAVNKLTNRVAAAPTAPKRQQFVEEVSEEDDFSSLLNARLDNAEEHVQLGSSLPRQRPAGNTARQTSAARPSQVSAELSSLADRFAPARNQAQSVDDFRSANAAKHLEAFQAPSRPAAQPMRQAEPQYQTAPERRDDPALVAMKEEMRFLRSLLENQLSGLAWKDKESKDPMKAMMAKKLMDMGFSSEIAELLVGHVSGASTEREGWVQVMSILQQQLPTTDDDIITQGGVVALLGATGVGKTTTIAKLAARYTLRYGPEDVALVSTDSYRIAAHEQLKTYGRILGCTVRIVDTPEGLSRTLDQLYDKRLILIDTAGMSQRDIRLPKQLAGLREEGIRNYLVLSSTAQRKVMDETIRAFKGIDLSGTILTKLDETMGLGESLSAVIKHRLPVSYITNGQRVPEDMEVASGNLLVKLLNQTSKTTSASEHWNSGMVA